MGQAIARRLAVDGAAVLVQYNRRGERAEALAAELSAGGRPALVAQADPTRPETMSLLIALTSERLGGMEIVVANAGVPSPRLPLDKGSDEAFERAFAGNARATLLVSREAARYTSDGGRSTCQSSTCGGQPVRSARHRPRYGRRGGISGQ